MANLVDLSKEQDLPGCVSAPLFLSELMRCLSEDVKKPATDMLQIFAEMAQYAAKKDDPRLNVLCLRLGLFKMPPDKLKEALEAEMERIRHPQKKDIVDAKPARNCDTKESIDAVVKRFKAENCDHYDNAFDDPRTQCHQNCVECVIKWMMANRIKEETK